MAERVRVIIDGEMLSVPAFTTVAAAIAMCGIGGGIEGTRRSVTGEPRAALCGMGVCHECRVTVDGRAHVLGCQTLCRDGLSIETTR
ncbi:NAD-dependent formate dehydrogenase subunit alpha [Caballeronia fortuita]|uniref:NAD-dependent formate dehydrogenase subunit alpha n=1 Tax=Caballeronia fortuita TaxID=1777138 RepID=A0A158DE90_9BURK|nr:2Fe-2S iron-sulfur cluster-binding protein [Caballeronia fortuita]SAK92586.1 NAD-dependent formate dehydrogenase subunit alpha [Caballeronia fortuita]